MSLAGLALVLALGLAGPLLAGPRRTGIPVAVGELAAGVVAGRTGFGWTDPGDPVFSFLGSAGFGLIMLVAGSHVPLRDPALRVALRRGAQLALLTGAVAVGAGYGVADLLGTGHALLYAVLFASSSAALVMPVIDEAGLGAPPVLATVVQVTLADTVCIVLLPLAEQPERAGKAALGVLAVVCAAAAILLVMRWFARRGWLKRMHRISHRRNFGLELRVQLITVFGLAGLAQRFGVSIMLAGFAAGLALAAEGEPRRLARQLFAVTDGFLGPLFFVWLGASLDLRAVAGHPRMIALAGALALGTLAAHGAVVALHQPALLAVLAAAQLGVPIAAVTIGTRAGLLGPAEGGAILAAALVTIATTGWAAARARGEVDLARAPAAPQAE
ncbi:cation:proton antiporter [Actinocrinis puniceicyclus]|uniref:Cation:proton antiporter n=1 Tax=Actinocrinis puniceicyclus TaxID=977794 RepID=A0A8J8BC84_9ACTN|nr:cation:proton antiporter [Actinocrinis puniceicyclus]MBS2961509.1 cation:proton antiporter [Actinocrinis puniceicyclus]